MAAETRKNLGIVMIALVLISTSFLSLWHLGQAPLQDYDEATYAQVVHEAFVHHDFISFTEGGIPFLKKPPLQFWAMGISESLFGESAFSMRLPTALFGIALIGVLIALAYELSKEYLIGALAGAIALTTGPLLETMREVRMDVLVMLCIMTALYAFMRGLRNPRWFVVFGLCVGLAVLTKNVIAVFAIIPALSMVFFAKRFDVFRSAYIWYGALLGALVALPWHLVMTYKHGFAFWQEYIGFEVIARTQENLFWTVTITKTDLWNYLNQFVEPWLWVFFITVVGVTISTALRFRKENFSKESLEVEFIFASLVTMACMALVFFGSATRAPTYLLLLYPFGTLVIALGFAEFRHTRFIQWGSAAACALVVWGGVLAVYNAYHYNPYYSIVLTMARDEKAIGTVLGETSSNTPWYVYHNQNLGSIVYYSQRLQTRDLVENTALPPHAYIVMDTDARELFAKEFPMVDSAVVYQGPQVMLVQTN